MEISVKGKIGLGEFIFQHIQILNHANGGYTTCNRMPPVSQAQQKPFLWVCIGEQGRIPGKTRCERGGKRCIIRPASESPRFRIMLNC